MRIGWIGGWAVPVSYVEYLSKKYLDKCEAFVVYPGEFWLEKARSLDCDLWIGYSLGAHLMLREKFGGNGMLICPFSYFNQRKIITYMQKSIKINVKKTIDQFYKKCGLPLVFDKEIPYSMSDLLWGLEVCKTSSVQIDNRSFKVYNGEFDEIVETKNNSNIILGATHNLEDYMSIIQNGIR